MHGVRQASTKPTLDQEDVLLARGVRRTRGARIVITVRPDRANGVPRTRNHMWHYGPTLLNVELLGDLETGPSWARQILIGVPIMRGTTVRQVISVGHQRPSGSTSSAGAATILVITVPTLLAGRYIRHGIRPNMTVDVPAK